MIITSKQYRDRGVDECRRILQRLRPLQGHRVTVKVSGGIGFEVTGKLRHGESDFTVDSISLLSSARDRIWLCPIQYVTNVSGNTIEVRIPSPALVIRRWNGSRGDEDYEICEPDVTYVKSFESGWKERQKASPSSGSAKTVELEPGEYITEVDTGRDETVVEVKSDLLPVLAQLVRIRRRLSREDPDYKAPFKLDPERLVLHCLDKEGYGSPEGVVEAVTEVIEPPLPNGTSVKRFVLEVLNKHGYRFEEIRDPYFEPLKA